MNGELIARDAEAVRVSLEVVSRVRAADLGRPTPCAAWTLRDLLAHMTAQHEGFAAAARGEGGAEVWRPRADASDPVGAYEAAAGRVLAAFAELGVLGRPFLLPEIDPERPVPGVRAVGFHLVDYVVHAWDVARSLGGGVEFGAEVLDAALAVARKVPEGDARTAPGAAFAPGVAYSSAGGTALGEILARLGRDPGRDL
ncbi:TIGR03086 family protein [Streptomyces spiroverticillatus]|uniref:TIGR03086 family protein n=2 Tax=Streptomyces finlayi TaxID=67296 RepID=A0A918WWQ8_9ACTN|nr:TIGR03086 family protein [Streptomyces spiroverticillatus]GHC90974.1 TIGR03086 family protein [Streptomyces finlayi]